MRKFILLSLFFASSLFSSRILIYMDIAQTDHLKAYGIAYESLEKDIKVEWLLNYRGGSFLIPYSSDIEKLCKMRGVSYSTTSEGKVREIYNIIENRNMEKIVLEKAPRIAVYVPHYAAPWDDAVRLALDYAEIPYDIVWDEEVLAGALSDYDWVHLHHEDFTGQWGKFYQSYRNTNWYKRQVIVDRAMAKKLGFKKVWQLKHRVAQKIKEYVKKGGFLFAMCSATETIDIALASEAVDIVPAFLDGDNPDPNCGSKLNFENTFAFENFLPDLTIRYRHSDIDVTQEAHRRGQNVYFTLQNFNAKYDPIPTMLTQDHVRYVKEFLGQCTGFRKGLIKRDVVILGAVEGTNEAKYIYGDCGRGFFTFYGGHDPEDYAHYVGDPPTDLKLHKNSPGYRLILNNVLFPAAKSKRLKT